MQGLDLELQVLAKVPVESAEWLVYQHQIRLEPP